MEQQNYNEEQDARKESYFANLRQRSIRDKMRRAHERMQRMRMVMNLASLALVFTAKTPGTREERRVESDDARRILSEQGKYARFL